MKARGSWKKFLSLLFVLGIAVVLLHGMSMTVNANTTSLVGTIVKVGDTITFSDGSYYIHSSGSKPSQISGTFTLDHVVYDRGDWKFVLKKESLEMYIYINGDSEHEPPGFKVSDGEGTQDKPYTFDLYYGDEPTPSPSSDNTPSPKPKHEQDQTLVTGFITNGNDANGNPTYAYFSQENVWSVIKVSSNANSITYDITPQWETYGTVNIGIPAPGFPDGPVVVDHYKNGKLIATYNGWVTSEWCTFDNPDGYSTFVIRKPGTNAQNASRAYVPNTGVE